MMIYAINHIIIYALIIYGLLII